MKTRSLSILIMGLMVGSFAAIFTNCNNYCGDVNCCGGCCCDTGTCADSGIDVDTGGNADAEVPDIGTDAYQPSKHSTDTQAFSFPFGGRNPCNHVWIANANTPGTVDRFAVLDDYSTLAGTDYQKPYFTHGGNPSRTSVDKDCNVWVANRGNTRTVASQNNVVKLSQQCGLDDTAASTSDSTDPCLICPIRVGDNVSHIRGISVASDNSVYFANRYADSTDKLWHYSADCEPLGEFSFAEHNMSGAYGMALNEREGKTYIWLTHHTEGVSLIILEGGDLAAHTIAGPGHLVPDHAGNSVNGNSYGITIDTNGDAWVGQFWDSSPVCRHHYDSVSGNIDRTCYFLPGHYIDARGVAVDTENQIVWVADSATKIAAFSVPVEEFVADSYTNNIGGTGINSYGIGIDNNGKLWSVGRSNVSFIGYTYEAATNRITSYDLHQVLTPLALQSYTYSDFTGNGIFNTVTINEATVDFDAGDSALPTQWRFVGWTVDTPFTPLKIQARVSHTPDFSSSSWCPGPSDTDYYVIADPVAETVLDLGSCISSTPGRYLQVHIVIPEDAAEAGVGISLYAEYWR